MPSCADAAAPFPALRQKLRENDASIKALEECLEGSRRWRPIISRHQKLRAIAALHERRKNCC